MSPTTNQSGTSAANDSGASFVQLIERLHDGDEDAAREIHRLFTPRLVALARLHFTPAILRRTDPESVIQSVYRSFFCRDGAEDFALGDWNDLWGLLSLITLRKCANRTRFHRQECRDVGREVATAARSDQSSRAWEPVAAEPSPHDAAVLCETVELLFQDLMPRERAIIEGLLQGGTVEEVRSAIGCGERTVRRVRDRVRAKLARMQSEE